MNPSNANFQPSSATNFTFKAVAGESVDLYYNFQMPSKAHFIESNLLFYQADNYQENRRFGLWLEGDYLRLTVRFTSVHYLFVLSNQR